MVEFFLAIVALLLSRALWDFTKRRAEAEGQSPLVWLLQVVGGIVVLGAIVMFFAACLLYLITR